MAGYIEEKKLTEEQLAALNNALLKQMIGERTMLRKASRGSRYATFVPSYRPYTHADLILLFSAARMNGGLLPLAVRKEMLKSEIRMGIQDKPQGLLVRSDDPKSMRNTLKRLRKRRG